MIMMTADRSRASRAYLRPLGLASMPAILALAVTASAAHAHDYNFGLYVAQGVAASSGNNYAGESEDISTDIREVGVYGTRRISPKLLLSGQLLSRRYGETDSGRVKLDHAFIDYSYLQEAESHAGIRLGRVKNPLGLYNQTRDVIFTRPSISLPQSVYSESLGFRDIFFSSDGAQLYGGFAHGSEQYLSANLTAGRDFNATDDTEDLAEALFRSPRSVDVRFRDNFAAQLRNQWGAGRAILALSFISTDVSFDTGSAAPPFEIGLKQYALSGQYNFERVTLSAAYSVLRTEAAGDSNYSDGAYLQAETRISPNWSVLLRYDAFFADRGDRDGSELSGPSHSGYAKDSVVGLRWQPGSTWDFLAEYHYISGSQSASILDNPSGDLDAHSHLLLLSMAWRFNFQNHGH